MSEIIVKDSYRQVIKRLQRAMQKSYLKVLTEPITNSEDSYRRLEENGILQKEKKKPIFVYITKDEKKFEVVDYAEGFNKLQMSQTFEWYGQDKETHETGSRGLFNQGLSDTLFTREKGGHLYSIKDGEVHHTEFRWKSIKVNNRIEKIRTVKIDDKKIRADREWREKLKIPEGNGTNVTFHFTEANFPNEQEIILKLHNFYMLRFINSDDSREVNVIFLEKNNPIKKVVIEWAEIIGEEIGKLDEEIKYKTYPSIKVKGKLFRANEELLQEEAGEDRVGGLLIYDEYKNVYDLSLFGYDGNPHARKFFGYLELTSDYKLKNIKGFKQIIRTELNNYGEEILTETRDGFIKSRKKDSFYYKLDEIIRPWLKKYVESEIKEDNESSNLTEESKEEQKKAFEILNRLYARFNEITQLGKDIGKKDKLPENGLEFDRSNAVITSGKKYYIGLKIDVNKIGVGSNIKLEKSNELLKIYPFYVKVGEGNEYGIFKTNIKIKGELPSSHNKRNVILKASFISNDVLYEHILDITIIKEEIFIPNNGLEFNPDKCRSMPGKIYNINLYVNKEIIPIGSKIVFDITNKKSKINFADFDEITFEIKHLLNDNIGLIKIPIIGYKDEAKSIITATFKEIIAEANFEVTYKSPKEEGKMFDGWDYKPLNTPLEQFYNEDSRKIEINSNIEKNSKFLGKDYPEATLNYERFLHCQIIVAERVIDESINFIITKAFGDGKIILDKYPSPIEGLKREVAILKKDTGFNILKHFVKEKSIKQTYDIIKKTV